MYGTVTYGGPDGGAVTSVGLFGPTTCRIWTPAARRRGAAAATVSLSLRAPCEPPNTRSVGRSGCSPNSVRPNGRIACRSRVAMLRRSGMPMWRACGSRVSGAPVATNVVILAPIRLASPGRAFASWITSGVPWLRAAR